MSRSSTERCHLGRRRTTARKGSAPCLSHGAMLKREENEEEEEEEETLGRRVYYCISKLSSIW